MSVLAHIVHNEEAVIDKLLHPFSGLDHIASMFFATAAITLFFIAMRGRAAATTAGTTTRLRSRLFVGLSSVLLLASVLVLVVV